MIRIERSVIAARRAKAPSGRHVGARGSAARHSLRPRRPGSRSAPSRHRPPAPAAPPRRCASLPSTSASVEGSARTFTESAVTYQIVRLAGFRHGSAIGSAVAASAGRIARRAPARCQGGQGEDRLFDRRHRRARLDTGPAAARRRAAGSGAGSAAASPARSAAGSAAGCGHRRGFGARPRRRTSSSRPSAPPRPARAATGRGPRPAINRAANMPTAQKNVKRSIRDPSPGRSAPVLSQRHGQSRKCTVIHGFRRSTMPSGPRARFSLHNMP